MAKEKICGIYCIFNKINHKRYIGQSVDIKTRWYQHKKSLSDKSYRGDNYHLTHAWHKYGAENFDFFIVEKCNKFELDTFETFWINYYDSSNPTKGYNKTQGGKYDYYFAYARQYRIYNIKEYDKYSGNYILSEDDVMQILKLFETGESNRSIAKKYNVSKSTIQSIRNHESWTYITDGLNIKQSDYRVKYNVSNGQKRSIDMYTLDGVYIKTFNSISQAAKEFNVCNSTIDAVCRGKHVSSQGYIFRYHNASFESLRTVKKQDPKAVAVEQYDLEWNYINSFSSINEARIATGINGIPQVLSQPMLTRGGYHWLRKGELPPIEEKYCKMKRWVSIDQYDLNWNLIATYKSIKQASQETNVKASSICNYLAGRISHAGNFYWRKHKEVC